MGHISSWDTVFLITDQCWIHLHLKLIPTILVFYCCITHSHKFRNVSDAFIISQFPWIGNPEWVCWDLCWESHQAEIKVLAGAMILIRGSGSSCKLTGCWQNSAPCSSKTEAIVFLPAVSQEGSRHLEIAHSSLPCDPPQEDDNMAVGFLLGQQGYITLMIYLLLKTSPDKVRQSRTISLFSNSNSNN